jgi:hypothetical protein
MSVILHVDGQDVVLRDEPVMFGRDYTIRFRLTEHSGGKPEFMLEDTSYKTVLEAEMEESI